MTNISSVKHLVDIDEEALASARLALGTRTIKDTVNSALLAAIQQSDRHERVAEALDLLAALDLPDGDRVRAWR